MVNLPSLPDLPDLPDIPSGDDIKDSLTAPFKAMGEELQKMIMKTIFITVGIGVSIAIVGCAIYLGYEFFVAPRIAKKKAETMREATQLMGTMQQIQAQTNPVNQILGAL